MRRDVEIPRLFFFICHYRLIFNLIRFVLPRVEHFQSGITKNLLSAHKPVFRLLCNLVVDEFVVKTDLCGVVLCAGVEIAFDVGPVHGRQTHWAWLA